MRLVRRIKSALLGSAPRAVIVKEGPRAAAVAGLLNSGPVIDPAIKAAVDQIRERMAADETPYTADYGGFRTQGEHAVSASSKDYNLAMLQALIRWRPARSVLEIGTAYGVGGTAIAMAGAKLTTVEGFEPQATLCAQNIASAGVEAECLNLRKEEAIPRLLGEGRKFDMVFHDGGHLGDAYVDDFAAIQPMLNPQGVFVIDNVFHDDRPERREWSKELSRRSCREGWEELLTNPLVEGAVVYRNSVGILLTR